MSEGIIDTMGLNELTAELRARNIKISNTTVSEYILQGKFKFADGIRTNKDNHFLIYRKLFEEWAKARERENV